MHTARAGGWATRSIWLEAERKRRGMGPGVEMLIGSALKGQGKVELHVYYFRLHSFAMNVECVVATQRAVKRSRGISDSRYPRNSVIGYDSATILKNPVNSP